MSYKSGSVVGVGFYWSPLTGDHISVEADKEAVLGEGTWYRVHPLLMLVAAPLIGLTFVMFLPIIGVVLTVQALMAKLGVYTSKLLYPVATPPALQGQAALLEKRELEEATREEKELAETVRIKRLKGEK